MGQDRRRPQLRQTLGLHPGERGAIVPVHLNGDHVQTSTELAHARRIAPKAGMEIADRPMLLGRRNSGTGQLGIELLAAACAALPGIAACRMPGLFVGQTDVAAATFRGGLVPAGDGVVAARIPEPQPGAGRRLCGPARSASSDASGMAVDRSDKRAGGGRSSQDAAAKAPRRPAPGRTGKDRDRGPSRRARSAPVWGRRWSP